MAKKKFDHTQHLLKKASINVFFKDFAVEKIPFFIPKFWHFM
jgi:hypothetical protein